MEAPHACADEGERSEALRQYAVPDTAGSAHDCIMTIDRESNIVEFNPGAEETFGLARGEALGRNLAELILPAHLQEEHRRLVAQCLGTNEPTATPLRTELIARRRNGSEFPAEITMSRVANTEPPKATVFLRDITQRKRRDKLLAWEKNALEIITSPLSLSGLLDCLMPGIEAQAPGALCSVLLLDETGVHLTHGSAPSLPKTYCEAIDGSAIGPQAGSCGTAAYTNRLVIVSDIASDPLWAEYKQIALPYGLRSCWSMPIRSSTERVLGTFAIYYREPREPAPIELELVERAAHIVSIAIERKALEARLRQSQKLEAIGQLAGGVAHDFNNLLTVIKGYTQLMLLDARLSESTRVSATQVLAASERASNLTRQLLAFSRKQTLHIASLDINDIVSDLAKLLQRTIGETISLHLDCGTILPPIKADAGMMDQVLLNLAINARDAMPGGGHLTIRTSARTFALKDRTERPDLETGTFVCLSVSDVGCGMSPEVQKHIFEPFFTTKEPDKGTGLGLATVHGIVEQHGGWIEVESEVGQGSTFRIFLPTALPGAEPIKPVVTQANLPRGTARILLVEDEIVVRELAHRILEQLGYRVYAASTGVEALSVWADHKDEIDLLLTDVVMPDGLSGHDLAAKLRVEMPNLRVVITSGYDAGSQGEPASSPNNIALLPKPYSVSALAQVVRDAMVECVP
jgi:two-component system cell cycle sensor histidine kinase/response regulator CckA